MISGIPAHPLFVHLAVVAVPVTALLLIYGMIQIDWYRAHLRLMSILTFIATAAAGITNSTGEALMAMNGATEDNPGIYGDHANKAKIVVISMVLLLILVLVHHWFAVKKNKDICIIGRMLIFVLSVTAIVGVVLAGHAGAELVWMK